MIAIAMASLLLYVPPAQAAISVCSAGSVPEQICMAHIDQIRPTQFTAGFREVEIKSREFLSMSESERMNRLWSHPLEGVIGPGGDLYIEDGHHFALAMARSGQKFVLASASADLSRLSMEDFWRALAARNRLYLMRFGSGPLAPKTLPRTLAEMMDDPFRSLSGAVRRAGGYRKTSAPFAEMLWADFFRRHVAIGEGEEGFDTAINDALSLAATALAAGLPGHIGAVEPACAQRLLASARF